jgi:branched-chain amino acid transport system ATP-binding protein
MAILEIEELCVNYGKVRALANVTLQIEEGGFIGLIGPNGAGKSTLLDTISGLTSDWHGKILYDGHDLSKAKPAQRVNMGVVHCPERRHLFPFMTVRDNLVIGSFSKNARRAIDENMEFVFNVFPVLKEKQNALAITLSGGQAQMLALGRAILSNPKILMLDEPMLGVAPVLRKAFSNALESLKERNITVLITEQELFLTISITDIIYMINMGRITDRGTPEEFKLSKNLDDLYFINNRQENDQS